MSNKLCFWSRKQKFVYRVHFPSYIFTLFFSADVSKREISDFITKSTPVFAVRFTRRNLLIGAGPYVT